MYTQEQIKDRIRHWEVLLANINVWVNKTQWYNPKNIKKIILEYKNMLW